MIVIQLDNLKFYYFVDDFYAYSFEISSIITPFLSRNFGKLM